MSRLREIVDAHEAEKRRAAERRQRHLEAFPPWSECPTGEAFTWMIRGDREDGTAWSGHHPERAFKWPKGGYVFDLFWGETEKSGLYGIERGIGSWHEVPRWATHGRIVVIAKAEMRPANCLGTVKAPRGWVTYSGPLPAVMARAIAGLCGAAREMDADELDRRLNIFRRCFDGKAKADCGASYCATRELKRHVHT